MRSVKPGRGPSFMDGIGALVVGVAGIGWTIGAGEIGAPGYFSLFGVAFVALAIAMAVYHFRNATSKNRFSDFDVVDGQEEPDPLNQRFGESRFCAACGQKLPDGAQFCPGCGKKVQ